ncbi:unnamed protein product [Phytophthora lilii]|uniref:Unnamed protein product n=1 Tax=Phytophthora lilii TaxID=2077276 RepID=A0A9W6TB63_9STRA|nr:unnamed protein product [Phytophthora lilii]
MADALWESELLRARQWLAATRQDRRQERKRLFQRVRAHIGFKDHQRSLLSAAADDDDDAALDFLADVDAADMSALLQAEAAKAAPRVELATPAPEHDPMPSAADLMRPLEMPSNLVSPTVKPHRKPVPLSQLDPKTITVTSVAATTTVSATLGSEESVQELMEDLDLEVTHHSDVEESKTEESTPPHLLKNFAGNSKGVSINTKQAGTGQSKFMQQVSSKSPQDPHKKKVVAPATATTKPDDVAAEMMSWVTGYRDPEVIRRKEKLRRKRKHTHRFGVSSEEEQRQVQLRVKQITHDSKSQSESESEDDFSSDYSPAEDDEVPEPDEPEVVDLLSDDYLDSDEDKRPVKRRKRLRQSDTTQKKKKKRSRKPAVTRKLSQQSDSNTVKPRSAEVPSSTGSTSGEGNHASSLNKSESKNDATNKPNQAIDLLSSGDEAEESGVSSNQKPVRSEGNAGAVHKEADSDASKGSTILRLAIPKGFQTSQGLTTPSNSQKTQTMDANTVKVSSNGNTTTGNKVPANTAAGTAFSEISGQTEQRETLGSLADEKETSQEHLIPDADDTDISDTGTVDLEGEYLSVENEHITHDEEITVPKVVASIDTGTAPSQDPVAKPDNDSRSAEQQPSDEVQHNEETSDADVSEAETEILEDDEPDTDDLGLDYSDDSDRNDKSAGNKNSGLDDRKGDAGDHKDGTDNKNDDTTPKKTKEDKRSGSDTKQETTSDKKASGLSASTAGVQQFFDFTPLKLKPKAKTITSTAPKPLPVHNYDETHLKKKESNEGEKAAAETSKTSATSTKSTKGSNGLRPSIKPIATSLTMKGKYAVTRRSTKMLEPEDTPGGTRQQKSQYTMVPTRKAQINHVSDEEKLDNMPLLALAKEMSKDSGNKNNPRYLLYSGVKKTEDAPSHAAEAPRIVAKSRFGGGGGINFSSTAPVVSNGQHSQVNDKNASQGGYRQEPQISIYDALHMDGQESASDISKGTGYKRPSRFKKMQEEAARNGTPMVKSRLQDTDWDKVPIPKKKKQAPQVEKPVQDSTRKIFNASESGNSAGKQNKRRKTKPGFFPKKNSGPSYYGPQSSQSTSADKYESPSRGRRGWENNTSRRDDDRRRNRSPSPPSRDRDRYQRDRRFRDDRRRRSRSRSRSVSPRGRDYGSSRYHRRSRSGSRSRERSIERDHQRKERPRDHDTNGSRRSLSPGNRDLGKSQSTKISSDPPELGEVPQNGKTGDADRSAKKQKISHSADAPPSPGALATFDDDGDNMFISDSDDEGGVVVKEVEDIRFDLESVPVDEAIMARQVYVTGVNPTVSAEQLEADFARLGVAVSAHRLRATPWIGFYIPV